jgi:hypothetical protein
MLFVLSVNTLKEEVHDEFVFYKWTCDDGKPTSDESHQKYERRKKVGRSQEKHKLSLVHERGNSAILYGTKIIRMLQVENSDITTYVMGWNNSPE